MIEASTLLEQLPEVQDVWVLIHPNQTVKDIVKEVLEAHERYASFYDSIALYFDADTTEEICQNLYNFLKANVKYREEPEATQTTALPSGILSRGYGDCKHYADFSGGVLNAINRLTGKNIKWNYRFASYDPFEKLPHHVFVVVKDEDGSEIWIDPTPGASEKEPVWFVDKKINVSAMALYTQIAGLGVGRLPSDVLVLDEGWPTTSNEVLSPERITALEEQQAAEEISPELEEAIATLLRYNVMNTDGAINDSLLQALAGHISFDEFEDLTHARTIIQEAITRNTMGNIFSTIWRGVKKVTLAIPRNAYLSLVALNIFGFATKLHNAIYNANGTYFQPNQNDLYNKWHSFGGDWHALEIAIASGFKKKAVLGSACYSQNSVGFVAAVPIWVASASVIITALTPLIKDLINRKAQAGELDASINPATGLPYGVDPNANPGGGSPTGTANFFDGIMQWVQANPAMAIGIGAGAYYLLTDEKKHK